MKFKEVEFGLAAAESEKTDKPHLLLEGFYETEDYEELILDDRYFLILGSKGSGKSAIGSRIELLSEGEDFYVRSYYLDEFPYSTFTGLIHGSESPEVRYPRSWEYILLTCYLTSLAEDEDRYSEGDVPLEKSLDQLKSLGLIPAPDLRKIVKRSARKEFKAQIPKLIEYSTAIEAPQGQPDNRVLLEALKKLSYSTHSENGHYIFVDGLDDVLTGRQAQYQSLSCLVEAVHRVNKRFRENGCQAKVVLFCRTDLLDQLQGPNKNKIKQDFAITLDWYQDLQNPKKTNLIRLINHRASLSYENKIDIFENVFTEDSIFGDEAVEKTLLNRTRHRPRDIIQLLNSIKYHTRGANVLKDDVINGMQKYSEDYFIPEVRDELYGFLEDEEIDSLLGAITNLGRKEFSLDEFEESMDQVGLDPDRAREYCEALFRVNAIGTKSYTGRGPRYTFRYRNEYATFNPNDEIVVHRGLHRGLNLL